MKYNSTFLGRIMHLRNVSIPSGFVIGATLLLSLSACLAQIPAFPGAEGWAAATPGGRGARGGLEGPRSAVIKVTNLNPDGEGSLREALESPGPRIVVFDVGGIIDLAGENLVITEPFLTLAGQSAPSPGITIIDGGMVVESTNDVVIRHIRVRPGAARHAGETWEPNGILVNNSQLVIIDHCSISWVVRESLSASGLPFVGENPEAWRTNTSNQITFSNSLIAEGLFNPVADPGDTSRGSFLEDNTSEIAVIKNLYTHNDSSNPAIRAGVRGVIMNNIVYDPGIRALRYLAFVSRWTNALVVSPEPPEARVSLVGNIMNTGSNFNSQDPLAFFNILDQFAGIPEISESTFLQLYVEDNLRFDPSGSLTEAIPEVAVETGKEILSYIVEEKPTWNDNFVQIPADQLEEYVLDNVGARPWEIDPVDERIKSNWQNGTGEIINLETDVGGFPELASTTHPEGWDTDDDGMQDDWEISKGLNPNRNDAAGFFVSPEGYSNIEAYLNELAAFRTSDIPCLLVEPLELGIVSLIAESFDEGSTIKISDALNASSKPIWRQDADGFPHTFEGFTGLEMFDRGFSRFYNLGNGLVPVPGGLEVNSIVGSVTLSAIVSSLSDNLDLSEPAKLSFWAGARNGLEATSNPSTFADATIRIVNVTDDVEILPLTAITDLNSSVDEITMVDWVRKDYDINFSETDIGDEIHVEWFAGGGFGGNGLVLADIRFIGKSLRDEVSVKWENLPGGVLEQGADLETWTPFETTPPITGQRDFFLDQETDSFFRWIPPTE